MDVLQQALAWHEAGEQVALATVLDTWGSAPRPVGSQMAVTLGGRIAGSVSGGCVESAVAQAAVEAISARKPKVLNFGVTNEQAWGLGLPCGGQIAVMVEPLA